MTPQTVNNNHYNETYEFNNYGPSTNNQAIIIGIVALMFLAILLCIAYKTFEQKREDQRDREYIVELQSERDLK